MTLHQAHRSHRVGWLRASVLGANDGIVSTSSLIIGVATADGRLVPYSQLIGFVALSSLVFLALLGTIAARAGGASSLQGSVRVTFWGALAMALTAGVGHLFGIVAYCRVGPT